MSPSDSFRPAPRPGLTRAREIQTPRVATNAIYYDKDHPSALVLTVVYLNGR